MGWRQYTPSSNATTLESKKSVGGKNNATEGAADAQILLHRLNGPGAGASRGAGAIRYAADLLCARDG